jgi:SAM-dependent methyltransferase
MSQEINPDTIRNHYAQQLEKHGATPEGVNWNSESAQIIRFAQLCKVIQTKQEFSLIDYGCGYGALVTYLVGEGYQFRYTGYDISQEMVDKAKDLHREASFCNFTTREDELRTADYCVESGIFNIRFEYDNESWAEHIQATLKKMDGLSYKGFAFNLLTRYTDTNYLRPELYYADPAFFFDYCKNSFSKNVALLHDYDLYDFTVIVRK